MFLTEHSCVATGACTVPLSTQVTNPTQGCTGGYAQAGSARKQSWSSSHPPLSISHDGSQNASPVSWNTLHADPVGHTLVSHGSVGKASYTLHAYTTMLFCMNRILLSDAIIAKEFSIYNWLQVSCMHARCTIFATLLNLLGLGSIDIAVVGTANIKTKKLD